MIDFIFFMACAFLFGFGLGILMVSRRKKDQPHD